MNGWHEFDIGIPGVVAAATLGTGTTGSPSFLEEFGDPKGTDALPDNQFMLVAGIKKRDNWHWKGVALRREDFPPNGQFDTAEAFGKACKPLLTEWRDEVMADAHS